MFRNFDISLKNYTHALHNLTIALCILVIIDCVKNNGLFFALRMSKASYHVKFVSLHDHLACVVACASSNHSTKKQKIYSQPHSSRQNGCYRSNQSRKTSQHAKQYTPCKFRVPTIYQCFFCASHKRFNTQKSTSCSSESESKRAWQWS